jgi:hypothetical protein
MDATHRDLARRTTRYRASWILAVEASRDSNESGVLAVATRVLLQVLSSKDIARGTAGTFKM